MIRCSAGQCSNLALANSEWCRSCWQRWWSARLRISQLKKAGAVP